MFNAKPNADQAPTTARQREAAGAQAATGTNGHGANIEPDVGVAAPVDGKVAEAVAAEDLDVSSSPSMAMYPAADTETIADAPSVALGGERPFTYTFFPNKGAKTKEERITTLPGLAELVKKPRKRSKESLPMFALARFGEERTKKGCLRHDDNMLATYGAVLDYDGEKVTPEQAAERLEAADIESLIYTSPSHTEEKSRFRVAAQASKELSKEQHRALVRRLNAIIGGIAAKDSEDLSRAFFFGSVIDGTPVRTILVRGSKRIDEINDADISGGDVSNGNGFDPFTEFGEQHTPVDTAKRLADMTYKAKDDTSIHTTQVSVSASLLNQGMDKEEVVATILDATKNAAPKDEKWNWEEEETVIRGMCDDWLEKKPHLKPVESNIKTLNVKLPPKGRLHEFIGKRLLQKFPMMNVADQLWRFDGTKWSQAQRGWLENRAQEELTSLGLLTTAKLRHEIKTWTMSEAYKDKIAWDSHGMIATLSGLLDPQTLELRPITPKDYVTTRAPCIYDPDAKCPWWIRVLADTFLERDACLIEVLQEHIGLALLTKKTKELTRATVFVGPSDSGKSTLIYVIAGILSDEVNATPFDALETKHGTVPFLTNNPWVLHEAFDQSKWHFSAKTKQLLSNDPIQVDIKHGAIHSIRYGGAVIWGTNHPPQFKEMSKAIINRMTVFECKRVFEKDTPTGAAIEAKKHGLTLSDFILTRERSGILNWALVGMQRALKRGYIATTPEIEAALHQVRLNSNLVAGFVEECTVHNKTEDCGVRLADFCASWAAWWGAEQGEGKGIPSNATIRAAVKSLGYKIGRAGKGGVRFVRGLHLNEEGLDCWEGASNLKTLEHKNVGLSDLRDSVNQTGLYFKEDQQ